ncbi:GNAT family N-acetyltransferase [Lysinibacillus mangiferihumi]|uniref:GNAT family N-acetyltransferase n=1 Tax=Lysinibacillus mangiferihumi TaxID=1130819 RepID=A0A4U2Z6N6_9BACI|nr:GNAT family protein [Lysinibacillus mangiferihumi]TKI68531.1 GNAT family N-acetyltransferase [Lysinibacillus mangiferihumi]
MFPILHTERLVLRELTENDAQAILSCFSNPDVLRHYGQKPLTSLEQVKQIIQNFSTNFKEKHGIKWGISVQGQEEIIGTIGFQDWSVEHKKADISYALFPNSWGQGYAKEAVGKVISYGIQEMNLVRIGAIVFTENEASNKLLKALGFEKEGVLRNFMHQNNMPYDTNVYSFIK